MEGSTDVTASAVNGQLHVRKGTGNYEEARQPDQNNHEMGNSRANGDSINGGVTTGLAQSRFFILVMNIMGGNSRRRY